MEHTAEHAHNPALPILFLVGMTVIASFYFGRGMKYIKLPSIIGYMVLGVILGPSLLNGLSEGVQGQLTFITEIALGFVAVSIGIELKLSSLKRLGTGIVYIIIAESFGAFLLVFLGVYIITKDLPLSLIFGAIAPASAPAGTVAVIQEYRTKGSLTKALYAIVGFDDGVGIIIFGFASAIARSLLFSQAGENSVNIFLMMFHPLKEIVLSILLGVVSAVVFSFLARKLKHAGDVWILLFGVTLTVIGICKIFHLSLILTNMVIGMMVANTQPHALVQKIRDRLPLIMPLLFILFFTLAGANLHLSALPALGVIGIVYVVARSAGKIFGVALGGMIGKAEDKIKKYAGIGILSQAGVAIGLALIVKHEFQGLGKVIDVAAQTTSGDKIGAMIITSVTATSIFFEIIGPILAKVALTKAGEINKAAKKG